MDRSTQVVLDLASTVLGDLDVEVVLERVLESAQQITGARYAALGVLDDSRSKLARFITLGVSEQDRRRIGPLPTGRGVLGELIRSPEPLRLRHVGSHPRSYGFPIDHPRMECFLGVPIVVAGEPFGNLYLTEKQGAEEFSQQDEDALMVLARFAGVAIDHARQFTLTEQQRLNLEQTVSALDATMQIAHALGGQTDMEAILELVAKRGRALVSARTLVIELARDGELIVAAGAGEIPAGMIGQRTRLEDTVASAALRTRQSQRLSDELNRSRFEQHGIGRFGMRAEDGIVVPMTFRNQPYGVLVALDRLDGDAGFSEQQQRLLEAFAASAATAVATAETAAAERRRQSLAAAEAERSRWARELHDETLQGLASLRLLLSAAHKGGRAEQMTDAISQAVEQLEADIANLRGLIADLRPATLDQLGLEAGVRALVERRAQQLELDIDVDLAYEQGRSLVRLAPEVETAAYRIVQEALTNAIKHGAATRASLELLERGGVVTILVRDNGSGFDTSAATDGFGLIGMHERVELLGGNLELDSVPGRGTTVTATLPARRIDDAAPRSSAITAG